MHRELQNDPKHRQWFYREVKLSCLAHHPNVARIFALGDWEGQDFISMEYIQGQTLRERLLTSGPLPLPEGKQVLLQLCAGLAHAHGVGIVHRDFKPSNIMLDHQGRAIILDFGISLQLSLARSVEFLEEDVAGTPHYVAPEQVKQGKVDHRADIFALGIVAYELFTGRVPYAAKRSFRIALHPLKELAPSPEMIQSDLPAELATIIARCTAQDPNERYESIGQIIAALHQIAPTVRLLPQEHALPAPVRLLRFPPTQGVEPEVLPLIQQSAVVK
jgi:serine/threonine-protein kinase